MLPQDEATRAAWRFVLGLVQMSLAAWAFVYLLKFGLGSDTWLLIGLATSATLLSRLLFAERKPPRNRTATFHFDNDRIMKTKDVVTRLSALAQESRLAIFQLLLEHGPEGLPAGQIAEALDLAPATLSFHLKALASANLVEPRQDGRFMYYAVQFDAMNELVSYLTQSCCRVSGSEECKTECAPQISVRKKAVA
jgi:DNA-binding transcriptional ArsR family regulator